MKNKIRVEEVGIQKQLMFNDVYLGFVYQEVDGFYVFKANMRNNGYWSEHSLREIAEVLTELNKEWNEHIEKEFSK